MTEYSTVERVSTFSAIAGKKVRALRESRNLSQVELAERMADMGHAWHQTTVSKVEAGTRAIQFDEAWAATFILCARLDDLVPTRDER